MRFGAYLRLLRGFGKDIILIAHMTEKQDGDVIKERLKIPGGSQDLVLTDSDVIGRISIHNEVRNLVFSPTETAFGKDPIGVGSMELPDVSSPEFPTLMQDIAVRIKEGLNSLPEAQVARKGEVEWFKEVLPTVVTDEGINDLLSRSKKAGRDVAGMVVKRADELGLTFDGDARKYVYLDQPQEDDQPEADAA